MISIEAPSVSASCSAALRDRSTVAPQVTIVRSVPRVTYRPRPKGTTKSAPGNGSRVYGWRSRCLCSRNSTGSSHRKAARSRPAASLARDG